MTTVAGGDFSPSPRRGGCAIKKSREASSPRADGDERSECKRDSAQPVIGDKLPKQICCGIGSPPRPLHRGGFATFYRGRGHPSSKRRGKLSSSNGLQTTADPLNIVPNAYATWISICPCDLIWTLVPRGRGDATPINYREASLY